MDNLLRQDFLNRTIAALENLIADLRGEREIFSENFRREAFRALHTIKGTAQTLGFAASGNLAHELENLLAVNAQSKDKISPDDYKNLFAEGLENLKNSFVEKDFKISAAFLERIGVSISTEKSEIGQNAANLIPAKIYTQLTNAEKGALDIAVRNEKEIFCLQVNFDLKNFAEEFVAFRETLCERCEIIATLPADAKQNEKYDTPGEIGFRVLLATGENIEKIIEKNSAEIVFRLAHDETQNDLNSILAQISADGKTLARQLGKRVEFEIEAEAFEMPAQVLKTIFDALAHLTRNAIDHGIDSEGKIKINLRAAKNGFCLTFADDGRGVDLEKLRAKAVEKNLISAGAHLTEQETTVLIFAPEVSTAASVSKISGRGVGLDVVKTSIEKLGGSVAAESEKGKGTKFEIFLPLLITEKQ